MKRGAALLAAALLLLGTGAQAQQAARPQIPEPPPSAVAADPALGQLRGGAGDSQGAAPASPGAPAMTPGNLRPAGRLPDQALMSPGLIRPAAPRLDRKLEAVTGGGSDCRNQCARELYQCGGTGEGGDCGESWSKCVLACPTASAAPL